VATSAWDSDLQGTILVLPMLFGGPDPHSKLQGWWVIARGTTVVFIPSLSPLW
jgi:hypothetical protein